MAGSTNFLGTSLEDIYRTQGRWNYDVPPIIASRYHSVLYELPTSLKSPPKPHVSLQTYHWDNEHVRMPYSAKNLFPVKNSNGEDSLRQRWEIIQEVLLHPINSSRELEIAINKYNTNLPKFIALHHFFEEVLENEESKEFFDNILPGVIKLALQLPEILPGNLPLLKKGACKSISLSQLQIASLLANAFLCTFPWRKDIAIAYPGVNFSGLFASHLRREQVVPEKLKCICHYFRRVLTVDPVGIVTFERKYFPRSHLPRWDRLENNLGNTKIHISSSGVIEDDGDGLLQVDFANKRVGGGVLGFGCVQEEIRYIICPELIVSRLFTEQLGSTEALTIIGVEQYSKYEGYGGTFMWSGNYNDNTPYDQFARRRTSIVAIDALYFDNSREQYNSSCILRELNKAYVGFHSRLDSQLPAVATGNWGCGAFHGDPNLKLLIQLMACSAARRDLVYFTFGDVELRNNIYEMCIFLATHQITITQLWRYLCKFEQANLKQQHLFSYIQQAHFDSKNQPSVKEFLSLGEKKTNANNLSKAPSTSSNNIEEIIIESSQQSISDIGSDDEIGSSQTENVKLSLTSLKYQGASLKNTIEQKSENNIDDVIRLINIIDGKMPSLEKRKSEGMSLSSTLNKFTKSDSNQKELKQTNNVQLEKMEVDEDIGVNNKSKQKITDYFSKIDKG